MPFNLPLLEHTCFSVKTTALLTFVAVFLIYLLAKF